MKSQGILLEEMVQELTKEADALATEAKTNKMNLLGKSNVKRSKIKIRILMVCRRSLSKCKSRLIS